VKGAGCPTGPDDRHIILSFRDGVIFGSLYNVH
jgi:hypothetical protein